MEDIKNKTDDELDEIIRRGENMNIPGSQWSIAKIEKDIRNSKVSEETTKTSNKIAIYALIVSAISLLISLLTLFIKY